MKRFSTLLLATVALLPFAAACNQGVVQAPGTASPTNSTATAEDKQWTMQNKNYATTRYSALDEINTGFIMSL